MTAAALPPVPEGALSVTPPSPQDLYARGFEGIAAEPFPEEARRILAEPVNPNDVEIKPDGIVFLPGVAWRRILTRAFGAGGWAIAARTPVRYMKDQNLVVYQGALFCLGRFVSEALGECFYRDNNPNMSYASAAEGARTDCIGRCARDLGYAAELWDANWREQWKAKYATTYQQDGKTKWKLKARVSAPHDLMAGAGGTAPPVNLGNVAVPSAAAGGRSATSSSARAPSPAPSSSSAAAPAAGPAPSDPTDTGEAASAESKGAIASQLKAKAWKLGMIRVWFETLFGVPTASASGQQILDRLTQQQADNAYVLLISHGTPGYDRCLAELRAKGQCRPEPAPGRVTGGR